ncbi:hypothetical protein ABLN97_01075 [Mycobacterium tuberculosis]
MRRAAVLGSAHEGRRLDQLRHEFGDAVAIIGDRPTRPPGWRPYADATRRAIANHAPVVYQAAMFDGRFVGFADFLIRDGHRLPGRRHQARPLANRDRALLQLAALSRCVVHSGVPVAADAERTRRDGTIVRYASAELIPVYRSQRARSDCWTATTPRAAVRWDDERVRAWPLSAVPRRLRASDDLPTGRRDAGPPARQAP